MRQNHREVIPVLADEERLAKWADMNIFEVTLAYLDREECGPLANRESGRCVVASAVCVVRNEA